MKWKRLLDILLGGAALLLLSPVFLLTMLAIKLDSPKERVLFRQERVGKDGAVFQLYKFRSMKSTAPNSVSAKEFLNAERYITPVGAFLRRTSIDELPQLFNVVKGDMSLIGPRPLVCTEEQIHFLRHYYGIYQLRPGITGLAQVNGRDLMDDYTKARWDRAYARHVGLYTDIRIVLRTIGTVLRAKDISDKREDKLLLSQRENLTQQEYDEAVRQYQEKAQAFGIDTRCEFCTCELNGRGGGSGPASD